jgi:hypothetical protein
MLGVYSSCPPYIFVAWYSIKHRENIAFQYRRYDEMMIREYARRIWWCNSWKCSDVLLETLKKARGSSQGCELGTY